MDSHTKKVMMDDVSLNAPSASLWQLQENKPEIRQVYGHFLPPYHMELIGRGLVAKDFNFPSAYHASANLSELNELYETGEMFKPDTIVRINDSIKIRDEKDGAIIYTPYFNGFYINTSAREILECCNGEVSIGSIIQKLRYDQETVIDFLARVLTLGLVNVCT